MSHVALCFWSHMNKMLKILLISSGVICIVMMAGFVFLISRLSPGYEVHGESVYFRSFSNVNFKIERREVKDADPDSIRSIRFSGGKYAKDKDRAFFEGISITDADVESFRVLDWRKQFSRDKTRVYWASLEVSKDPEHFEILGAGYSRDRENVYNGSRPIEGADPNSFVVTDATTFRAKDKHHRYNLGRIED